MVQEFLKPVVVDEDAMAFSAMEEVGPGGHFFGAQHTLERYSTAFYQPLISDWRNFPNWEAAGRPRRRKRPMRCGSRRWPNTVSPLDPAALEEIDAFVARRVAEGGEKTDF